MSFKISPRESITRCQVYDNKFRCYPEEMKLREARLKSLQDVIEPESVRLERQIAEKLNKGFFQHQGPQSQFIKKVGKFIFVATIVSPLYIATIIPRLIVQYALPFTVNIVGLLFEKTSSFISRLSTWVANGLNTLAGIFASEFSRLFKIRLKKTEKADKSLKNSLFSRFKLRLKPLKERFSKKRKEFAQALYKKIQSITHFTHKIFSKLAKPLLTPFYKVGKILKNLFTKLHSLEKPAKKLIEKKQSLKNRFSKYFTPAWHREFREKILNKTIAFLKATQNVLFTFARELRYLNVIFSSIGLFFYDILRYNYQKWVAPHVKWIAPLIKRVMAFSKRSWFKLKQKYEYLSAQLNRLSKMIQNRVLLISDGLLRGFKAIQTFYGKIYQKARAFSSKMFTKISRALLNIASKITLKMLKFAQVSQKLAITVFQTVLRAVLKAPRAIFNTLDLTAKKMIAAVGMTFIYSKVFMGLVLREASYLTKKFLKI